jgi:putative ABC transport system ATP-binding protein
MNVDDAPAPNMVEGCGLSRRYGEGEAAVDALVDVSVVFPEGRFAAIMGPSGSGKSTLMHILAGLDRPTSGTVSIAGVELTGLSDRALTELRRDRIGFIFQTSCCRCRSPGARWTASGSSGSSTRSASATA